MKTDDRLAALTAWVTQIEGFEDARPVPASEDASFRRYFRVVGDASYIVMDAPPPMEDTGPFVKIAGYLAAMSLNAPRILERDADNGFLLMSDLGSTQYLAVLDAEPARAGQLYADAVDALAVMQQSGARFQSALPPYDEEMMRFELSIFRDWLCGTHLGLDFSADDEREWQRTCDVLVDELLEQPRVFVHRDYHSRNLMLTDENNPGILDFQDAVEGPRSYDLVSLLKDCYIAWPDAFVQANVERFVERAGINDAERFRRDFDVAGALRHLKAAGIFARLFHRDGKPGYLRDIPRTIDYVARLRSAYGEFEFLTDLIETRVQPALERVE
jgi:aminoglycoside/choline kinase family phosphotransferase